MFIDPSCNTVQSCVMTVYIQGVCYEHRIVCQCVTVKSKEQVMLLLGNILSILTDFACTFGEGCIIECDMMLGMLRVLVVVL